MHILRRATRTHIPTLAELEADQDLREAAGIHPATPPPLKETIDFDGGLRPRTSSGHSFYASCDGDACDLTVERPIIKLEVSEKERCLYRGLKSAQTIISKAHDKVLKKGDMADRICDGVIRTGLVLSGIGACAGPLGAIPGLLVTGLGAAGRAVNASVVNFCTAKMECAQSALDMCRKPDCNIEERQQAFNTLRSTSSHLTYWEKTPNAAKTAGTFLVGEAVLLVDLVLTGLEIRKNLRLKKKERATIAESFMGALGNIRYGLDLKKNGEVKESSAKRAATAPPPTPAVA